MPELSPTPTVDWLHFAQPAPWHDKPVAMNEGFWRALPIALGAHLLVFWIATGGLDGLLPVDLMGVPSSPQTSAFGDKAGEIDGIAAEVIDAAEFDKRFISFKPGRDVADAEAAPSAAAQTAAAQTSAAKAEPPPPTDQPELPPETGPGLATSALPAKTPNPQPDPQSKPKPNPQPQQALSDADIAELLAQSQDELQGSIVAEARPGGARLGETSLYVRGVLRQLKKAMPRRAGIKGIVVVQFVISDTGFAEAAQIVRGSGRPELDKRVLDSIVSAQFTAPSKETTKQERMFQITYHYE